MTVTPVEENNINSKNVALLNLHNCIPVNFLLLNNARSLPVFRMERWMVYNNDTLFGQVEVQPNFIINIFFESKYLKNTVKSTY